MNTSPRRYDLIVIGGGAAGFFGALNAAEANPKLKIAILEKSPKLLSKVKVSGGGRCNVTHHCFESTPLSKHYPRGQRQLKKMFRSFGAHETVNWFAKRGVTLKTEQDGRMFPVTDDSQTIINCFLKEANYYNVDIFLNEGVVKIEHKENFLLTTTHQKYESTKVLVAIGGHPQSSSYDFIRAVGHQVTPLIPSLFTFNDSQKEFKDLMGIAVNDAAVKIVSTDFIERGPVLITHWGISGPAVIKLSAWAAEYLHQKDYRFTVHINWLGTKNEDETREFLQQHKAMHGKQKVVANPLFGLPARLWEKLTQQATISGDKIWAEISLKEINRLVEQLIRCAFEMKGKTTFKEEFVTCGGVDLQEIELDTMQSKKVPGLYFTGEVLNIDGETGGFNFQAAWTTAFLAAKSIALT